MRLFFLIISLMFPLLAQAGVPTQIGGIELGTNISDYQKNIRPQTKLPIRFMEYLEEVEVHSLSGFKSGYIAFGNCADPGRIVRIKLKYANSSKDFFEDLFKEYKSELGRPSEWLGDPFHVITAWKWSLSDGQQRVDLYLQHNASDATQKLGTSMKMTMNNLVDEERECFHKQFPEYRKKVNATDRMESEGWQGLIPE